MAWDEALKQKIIAEYVESNPTADNSAEIVKELAEKHSQSPNGVRMVLVQADVYVKKSATTTAKPTGKTTKTSGAAKVSKEDQIAALRSLIEARGKEVDDEILGKLTGKAAAYLTEVFTD